MRKHRWTLSAAVLTAIAGIGDAAAEGGAWSFDGITVIELKDATALQALGSGSGDYLVMFVSGVGSYAATVGARRDRGCIAWAREGSNTGTSISFGLAIDEYEVETGLPPVCLPFTVAFEDEQTVRVSAENRVRQHNYPGAAPAPLVRYSRKRAVIDRVPLRALDWSLPPFVRHQVKNVRLGPIKEGSGVDYRISNLRRSGGDVYRAVQATAHGRAGGANPDTVLGRAAPKELTGWPWDAVHTLWSVRNLASPSTRTAFEASIIERYGSPSFVQNSGPWYWFYDLDGVLLAEGDGAVGNCLHTMELWNRNSLVSQNADLGPWGCSLLMTLSYGVSSGAVSNYRIELLSGYAKATSHFLGRVEELEERRQALRLIENVEPRL